MKKVVIAHRGASRYKPENTLEAFLLAVEQGADMVEMDLRKNSAGEFVLQHDLVKGAEPGPAKLLEVLKVLKGKTRFDIELKESGYEAEVIQCILSVLSPEEFMVSSFNPRTVELVKERHSNVQAGIIIGPEGLKNIVRMALFALSPQKYIGLGDFLVLHKFMYSLDPVDKFSWFAKPVYVWTVDSEQLMYDIARDGRAAGIVTNTPDVCRNILAKASL